MLIGNKSDMTRQRQVTYEEGLQFAQQNKIDLFMETSAKTSENVSKAFHETAKIVFEKIQEGEISVSDDDVNSSGVKFGALMSRSADREQTGNSIRVKGTTDNPSGKTTCCGGASANVDQQS
jgi:Ras-related protein Rab-2A